MVLSTNKVTVCSFDTGDFEFFEALQRYQHYMFSRMFYHLERQAYTGKDGLFLLKTKCV